MPVRLLWLFIGTYLTKVTSRNSVKFRVACFKGQGCHFPVIDGFPFIVTEKITGCHVLQGLCVGSKQMQYKLKFQRSIFRYHTIQTIMTTISVNHKRHIFWPDIKALWGNGSYFWEWVIRPGKKKVAWIVTTKWNWCWKLKNNIPLNFGIPLRNYIIAASL